jgi:glucose/arabinose dehydrogenase
MTALLTVLAVMLAGCGGQGQRQGSTVATRSGASAATARRAHTSAPTVRYARVPLLIPAANQGQGLSNGHTLTLPRGWRVEVWARVQGARLEAWTPEGDLLVSSPEDGEVIELTPGANRSEPPTARTLVSGLNLPQGLAFDELDGHEVLYVAESDQIDRYAWVDGQLGARTVVVAHLPDTGPSGSDVHQLKNVVVGADHTVYVDIGSASNASPQPRSSGLPRASVIAFRPNGSHVRVFATGVRNGDGLSIAPDGTLWTAINERDDIAYPFHRSYHGIADPLGQTLQAYVNDHPPDELARLTPGRNVGWPFCDPDPDLEPGHFGSPEDYANMRFDDDVQTNAGGKRLDCAKLPRIQRGIPAHSAPLGFHFLEGSSLPSPWTTGAVVAVHGSWDRVPPRAPGVLWLPWESSKHTLGSPITLVSGFQEPNGARWGRPVDALPGPDGALYVSDDLADAIYRIVPTKGF